MDPTLAFLIILAVAGLVWVLANQPAPPQPVKKPEAGEELVNLIRKIVKEELQKMFKEEADRKPK
jgi:uncharacterized membrane protein